MISKIWWFLHNNFLALFLSLFIVSPTVFWLFDRTPPFEIIGNDPLPNPAKPWDKIDMQWKIIVHRNGCWATFRRTITDPNPQLGLWVEPKEHESLWPSLKKNIIHQLHTTQPLILPNVSRGVAKVDIYFKIICNPTHYIYPINYMASGYVTVE